MGRHRTRSHEQRDCGADQRATDARKLWLTTVAGGEKRPVEIPLDCGLSSKHFQPRHHTVVHAPVRLGNDIGHDPPAPGGGVVRRLERQDDSARGLAVGQFRDLDQTSVDVYQHARHHFVELLSAGARIKTRLQLSGLLVCFVEPRRQRFDFLRDVSEFLLGGRSRSGRNAALQRRLARFQAANKIAEPLAFGTQRARLDRQALLGDGKIGRKIGIRALDGDVAGGAAHRRDSGAGPPLDPGPALVVEVGIGGQQERNLDGLSDQRRIGHDLRTQPVRRAGGHDAVERATIGTARHIGKLGSQGIAHQRLVIAVAKRLRVAGALRIDVGG